MPPVHPHVTAGEAAANPAGPRYPAPGSVLAVSPEPRRGALFALTGGAFLFSMQQSLVVPALATVQRELNTSATMATWLITALLVASAVATPIFGRLGDMFGRSRMLVLSLVLLCAGTLLSALAPNIGILLIGRALQGLGGGMTSLTFSVVRDVVPAHKIAGGMGLISAMMSIGAATGIVFSGPIATALGYHWLFWLPLMVMVPITVFTARVVPPSAGAPGVKVDWVGAALLSTWLTTLLIAVSQGPSQGWASPLVIAAFAVAAVVFIVWIAFEQRLSEPLVNINLLRRPMLWRVNAGAFFVGVAMQATFTFVPRLAQTPESTGYGLGVPASRAGLVTLLWSIGSTVAGFGSGRLVQRRQPRTVMLWAALCAVAGYVGVFVYHSSFTALFLELGLFGFGVGLYTAVIPNILVHEVRDDEIGLTTGLNQVMRTIGGAVGAQTVTTILASGPRADGFPREAMYTVSFGVLTAACVAIFLAALVLPRSPKVAAEE